MQTSRVLALSFDTAEHSNAVVGVAPSHRIRVNPKVLRAGGFASEKERLGVQTTLTHCRPLEAHLSRAIDQQDAELQYGGLCFVIWNQYAHVLVPHGHQFTGGLLRGRSPEAPAVDHDIRLLVRQQLRRQLPHPCHRQVHGAR
jgi:hypothetical protein